MDDKLYLCKWNRQLWPAKILRRAAQKSKGKNDTEVEILGEKERLWVQWREMVPLTKERIDRIAQQLDHHAARDPTDELKYRKALRLALNIFAKHDGQCSPEKEPPQLSPRLHAASARPASPPDPAALLVAAAGMCRRSSRLDSQPVGQLLADCEPKMVATGPQLVPEKRQRLKVTPGEAGRVTRSVSAGNGNIARTGPAGRGRRKRKLSRMSMEGPAGGGGDSKRDRWEDAGGEDTKRTAGVGPLKSQAEVQGGVAAPKSHARRHRASGRRVLSRDLSPAPPRDTLGNPRGRVSDSQQPTRATFAPHTDSACPSSGSHMLDTQRRARTRGCQRGRSVVVERQQRGARSKVAAAGDKARPRGRPRKAAAANPGGGTTAAVNPGDGAAVPANPGGGAAAAANPGGGTAVATNPGGRDATPSSVDTLPTMTRVQPDSSFAESLEDAVGSPAVSPIKGLAGETSWFSDLSIELSLQEDPSPQPQEESDEQEDEELPSFLLQTDKKPDAIKEGNCVWCKYRSYPYWPAVVKAINRKRKKASIIFIDPLLFETQKGLSVGMRSIKPFDCELKDQLEAEAKIKYRAVISWCVELIKDYRLRIGCGSFSGSFMKYFADDISCPVRRMYLQGASDVVFPSKQIMEEQGDLVDNENEDGTLDLHSYHLIKKLLPDRSKAARNQANEKLVQFIVEKRGVEKHLQAIISGQVSSKWLMALLKTSRTVDLYNTYLEDEDQIDQVYRYLKEMYKNASQTAPCLAKMDRVRLILDALYPEAMVHAISGVFKISLEKAEDKYLKGPSLSEREREAFDRNIEEQMTTQSVTRCPA